MIKPNLYWIDAIKGICMLCVYLCHSEIYYSTDSLGLGYWVKPFYVNAFFFVSGYLFFGKWLIHRKLTDINGGGYRDAIKNLFFRLVLPTILFSSLIYIPKIAFHAGSFSLGNYVFEVFGGISYWFTSALTVAQLALFSIMLATKLKSIYAYVGLGVLLFVAGWYMNSIREGNEAKDFFPWFYQTGLQYIAMMTVGGLYKTYESRIGRLPAYVGMITIIAYGLLLLVAKMNHIELKMLGLSGQINLPGLICLTLGVTSIITICKKLPQFSWLAFIGRNSILFYFFSGVYPAFVGSITSKICPDSTYSVTLIVAIVSVLLGTITTFILSKYFPFLVDLRKFKQK